MPLDKNSKDACRLILLLLGAFEIERQSQTHPVVYAEQSDYRSCQYFLESHEFAVDVIFVKIMFQKKSRLLKLYNKASVLSY